MPFLNAPQAPSRAFYQPQIPQTSIDIGGSNNSDMALMLALIDMLNRTEESKQDRELNEKLANLQEEAQRASQRSERQLLYERTRSRIGNELQETKRIKRRIFDSKQAKLEEGALEVMASADEDAGVRAFLRGLQRLPREAETKILDFINVMPDRVESVLDDIPEPLKKLRAAKILNTAIQSYAGSSEPHSDLLEDSYSRNLGGLSDLADDADRAIGRMLEENLKAFDKYLQGEGDEIQAAMNTAGELDDPMRGLPGINRRLGEFRDPSVRSFAYPNPFIDQPGSVRKRRKPGQGVVKKTLGVPGEVIAKTRGIPGEIGEYAGQAVKYVAERMAGEEKVRTPGGSYEVRRPAEDILNMLSRKAHGFAPEELFTGLPQSEMRFDLPGLGGLPTTGVSRDRAAVPSFLRPNLMGPPGPTEEEILEALQSGLIGG